MGLIELLAGAFLISIPVMVIADGLEAQGRGRR